LYQLMGFIKLDIPPKLSTKEEQYAKS